MIFTLFAATLAAVGLQVILLCRLASRVSQLEVDLWHLAKILKFELDLVRSTPHMTQAIQKQTGE